MSEGIDTVDAFHANCPCDECVRRPYRVPVPPEEDTMIVEYIRYSIDAARAKQFLSAYETAGKSLRDSKHCLGYELSQCTEATESFTLRIQWDSEEGHIQGFRTSPEFKLFFVAVQPFIKDITEMRPYELTSIHWAR